MSCDLTADVANVFLPFEKKKLTVSHPLMQCSSPIDSTTAHDVLKDFVTELNVELGFIARVTPAEEYFAIVL
jgi:hypothetical protein